MKFCSSMFRYVIHAAFIAFAAAMVNLPVTTVLAQNTDSGIAPGFTLTEVGDGLYSFGNGGVFGAFLVTDEGVIVMDTLNPTVAQFMQAAIRSVTDKPVVTVVYSHNHWDHIGGAQVFKDQGATVLAHEDINEFLVNHPVPNPSVADPDETWAGTRHDIVLGGQSIELHHFGPSHGKGMTIFRFPEQKAIYVVDLVVPNRVAFTYMPDFTPRGWIATLAEIDKLEFDQVMFAHGAAVGPKSSVSTQRQFLLDLQNEISERLKAGENPMEFVNTLSLPKYKDWAGYDEWLPMNAWRMMLEMMMGV